MKWVCLGSWWTVPHLDCRLVKKLSSWVMVTIAAAMLDLDTDSEHLQNGRATEGQALSSAPQFPHRGGGREGVRLAV